MVVDIVPNHSSNHHRWFVEALAAPRGARARRRYVFRDGRGPGGQEPPSTWRSLFGGPAWSPVGDGQRYLHNFAPEQPDLAWDDEDVRADFLTTLRFWSDRGVDGFRVDAAHGLVRDVDRYLHVDLDPFEAPRADGSHPLWDRDALRDVYAARREVFDSYDPPRAAVAEAAVHPWRRARYASPTGLGQAFNFDLLDAEFDADAFRDAIDAGLAQAAGRSSSTWTLSNHDTVRHASRFGLSPQPGLDSQLGAKAWVTTDGRMPPVDAALGLRRACAGPAPPCCWSWPCPVPPTCTRARSWAWPGVADLPWDVLQDPVALRSGGTEKGRDGCRVPLRWAARPAAGSSFGFGPGGTTLPPPAWFAGVAVDVRQRDPDSTLHLYRRALRLRRELSGAEELTWLDRGSTSCT